MPFEKMTNVHSLPYSETAPFFYNSSQLDFHGMLSAHDMNSGRTHSEVKSKEV